MKEEQIYHVQCGKAPYHSTIAPQHTYQSYSPEHDLFNQLHAQEPLFNFETF